jgi:nucleotide-binding universal stress UspA family protein
MDFTIQTLGELLNPVGALRRILTAAVVELAADDVSDQQGIDMAFAYILALANATPKSSIFYTVIDDVEHAVEVVIDGPIVGTPEHVKRLASILEERIAKAKTTSELLVDAEEVPSAD